MRNSDITYCVKIMSIMYAFDCIFLWAVMGVNQVFKLKIMLVIIVKGLPNRIEGDGDSKEGKVPTLKVLVFSLGQWNLFLFFKYLFNFRNCNVKFRICEV